MYQNLANQNPILNQFNGYLVQNPQFTPFQNNQLINNNVHVRNNLNDMVQQHKMIQQNMPMYQQQFIANQTNNQPIQYNENIMQNKSSTSNRSPKSGARNSNIIEEMLKPQKIIKDGKDVLTNFKIRKEIQKKAKKGDIGIKMTNAPYKSIIKDKIITKAVDEVVEEDLIVHKVNKKIDADVDRFNKELNIMIEEKEKINEELEIEFHIDNYDKHKKNYAYKETFIRNMAYEENTFDENKQDYIDFYKQKQKEAEEGQKLCDQILHNIIDEGIICKDELPSENTNTLDIDANLQNLAANMNTDENVSRKPIPKSSAPKSSSVGKSSGAPKKSIPNNSTKTKSQTPKIIIKKNTEPDKKSINTNQNVKKLNSNPRTISVKRNPNPGRQAPNKKVVNV